MSDILNAVNAVKPLIQALDGLRLLTPFLEKAGSLEQSVSELEAIRKETEQKCLESKAELSKLNVDLASVKSQSKEILKEAKEKADQKILFADKHAEETIAAAAVKAADIINKSESDVNQLVEIANAKVAESANKHNSILKEIAESEEKLKYIREAIFKITGV